MPPVHCIFWDYFISTRSGGPVGYLAHLRTGLDRLPHNPNVKIWIERTREDKITPWQTTDLTVKDLEAQIAYFEDPTNFELSDEQFDKLMAVDPVSVHLHSSPLAYKVQRSFRKRGVAGIPIILTSHTPESNGKEMADTYRVRGFDPVLTNRFEAAVRLIEALAFRGSDLWIFPSPEAIEPYLATIPDFGRWMDGKDIRYVATGARPPATSVASDASKGRLGVEGRKVISFIGRHNEVKGYDLFCEAALKILDQRDDVTVLVAGAESSALPAPQHDRWIELGWYPHPGDVLAASDVFVLPNRMTYFDLVLIEALAMRTRTVASATGGNKSVAAISDGAVALFDGSVADLVARVTTLLDHAAPETAAVDRALATAYDQHFTDTAFAARYERVIAEIHADYGLGAKR